MTFVSKMSSSDDPDYKRLLSFLMHDLRHINVMIQNSVRMLTELTRGAVVDSASLRPHALVAFEQATVLSAWLATVDMYIDPDRFAKEPAGVVSVHGIFHKASINFERVAAQKQLQILVLGHGRFCIRAHPVIDVVPYILLDNAVKYSPNSSRITVNLFEDDLTVYVQVCSLGPCLKNGELNSLCTSGFRGDYARQRSEVGTGQGLALLKTICDAHAATISISSESQGPTLAGVPFGHFTVKISIPKSDQI